MYILASDSLSDEGVGSEVCGVLEGVVGERCVESWGMLVAGVSMGAVGSGVVIGVV